MSAKVFRMDGGPTGSGGIRVAVIAIVVLVLFALANPIKVIPAGHVGVKDFFGIVSKSVLSPGVHLVFPLTRVVRMTTQTQQIKETAEVPSQEGLINGLLFEAPLRALSTAVAGSLILVVFRGWFGIRLEQQ